MKEIDWDSKVETISDFIAKYGIKGAHDLIDKHFSEKRDSFIGGAPNPNTFHNIMHIGEMLEDLERALTNASG
jgi:hypothetical protein